jgi:tetratricopeptide (TPR) repeat protein
MESADRSAEEFFNRGRELFKRERYREAAEAFERSILLAPDVPNSHFLLGASRERSDDLAGALLPLARCVYFVPDHADARNALGQVLSWLGRTEDAAVHLARGAFLGHPQSPDTLAEMGMDYCRSCAAPLKSSPCPSCAGERRAITSPRERTWPWAYRPDDWRSKLTLPSGPLSELGLEHLARYRGGGEPGDIDDAITYLELAAATAEIDGERAARLAELGMAYRERFGCHGFPADLEHAIDCGEQALGTVGADDPERARILSNLSLAYAQRYKYGESAADLDRATELIERALAVEDAFPGDRAAVLANAGSIYNHRLKRDAQPGDLDRSIDLQEQAVAATPADHQRLAVRLNNLGNALMDRYDRLRAPADLDRSLVILERAVAVTPEGDRSRPVRLANLGLVHHMRYSRDRLITDLDRAIELLQQAEACTPEGHPDLARQMSNLSAAYLARWDADGRLIDRRRLDALVHRLASATTASPRVRIDAGHTLGTLAQAMGENAAAARVLDAAVALLPAVAESDAGWTGHRTDLEYRLGGHGALVSEAVAAHCALGDPTGAVEIAEMGRGVLLAAQLNARTDLTDLEAQLPELAEPLRQVRDHLNAPDQAGNRTRLWAKYEDLATRVREHPEFRRFLLPPPFAELRHAAAGGTVIMVNAGALRSDAILIAAEGDPVCVSLPNLSSRDVEANSRSMVERRALPRILGWLWDAVVEPVVEALPATSGPRRVWWLPIGLLGLFPLHAAGHPGQPGALDAFVSSYTPTLRVLAHTHDRPPAGTRRQLTVALEHTPGLPSLPWTLTEAHELHRNHPGGPQLLDRDATVGEVLEALPKATWTHFACHAMADHSTPGNGGLLLHDGTLTIPDISGLDLGDAELAYLSACSTADRSQRHVEESINLASAFHLAGFRHVIASLWPLADHTAAAAARSFYNALTPPTANGAAAALHRVTRELRDRESERPELWAPLIHSGP